MGCGRKKLNETGQSYAAGVLDVTNSNQSREVVDIRVEAQDLGSILFNNFNEILYRDLWTEKWGAEVCLLMSPIVSE